MLTTTGQSINSTKLYTKVGEEFQVAVVLAANANTSWTGCTGTAQVRNENDALIYDFGTVNATLDGDGNATLTFTAASAATLLWNAGTYYVDFSYETTSYGPRMTPTFRVIVSDGPTNL